MRCRSTFSISTATAEDVEFGRCLFEIGDLLVQFHRASVPVLLDRRGLQFRIVATEHIGDCGSLFSGLQFTLPHVIQASFELIGSGQKVVIELSDRFSGLLFNSLQHICSNEFTGASDTISCSFRRGDRTVRKLCIIGCLKQGSVRITE